MTCLYTIFFRPYSVMYCFNATLSLAGLQHLDQLLDQQLAHLLSKDVNRGVPRHLLIQSTVEGITHRQLQAARCQPAKGGIQEGEA